MVTILRAHGFSVVIFTDDHEPAHVHVFGDGHAKINLAGSNGEPELVWVEGMKRNEIRRVMRIAIEHKDAFLERWREIHG